MAYNVVMIFIETPIFTKRILRAMDDDSGGAVEAVEAGNRDGGIEMNKKNFAELLQSVKEAGKIMRGEMKPSRQFVFDDKEDIQEVRQGFNASQSEFARFMGVSIDTLQNWEQGRRHPTGPAKVLLQIVVRKPEIFTEMRREESREFVMA